MFTYPKDDLSAPVQPSAVVWAFPFPKALLLSLVLWRKSSNGNQSLALSSLHCGHKQRWKEEREDPHPISKPDLLLSAFQEGTTWFFPKRGWEVIIPNFLVSQKQQKLLAELSKIIFFCITFYLLHGEWKGKIEEKAEVCKELEMLPLSKRVLLLQNLSDSKGASPQKSRRWKLCSNFCEASLDASTLSTEEFIIFYQLSIL